MKSKTYQVFYKISVKLQFVLDEFIPVWLRSMMNAKIDLKFSPWYWFEFELKQILKNWWIKYHRWNTHNYKVTGFLLWNGEPVGEMNSARISCCLTIELIS